MCILRITYFFRCKFRTLTVAPVKLQDLRLYLTCGFKLTKFAQCLSETCFRNAHFGERHTIPIWAYFRMAYVSKRHAITDLLKKRKRFFSKIGLDFILTRGRMGLYYREKIKLYTTNGLHVFSVTLTLFALVLTINVSKSIGKMFLCFYLLFI